MTDRMYWHVPGARSWHADADGVQNISLCGRWPVTAPGVFADRADRIPPTAHLCGNCARIIAARTDIEAAGRTRIVQASEEQPDFVGHQRAHPGSIAPLGWIAGHVDRSSDQPEPVASEQDDWSPV